MSDSSSRKYPLSSSSSLFAVCITGNWSTAGQPPVTSCDGPPQSRTETVAEDRLPDLAYCIRLPSHIQLEVGLHNLPDLRVQAHRGFREANLGGAELPTKILCLALKETSRLCLRHRRLICEATAVYLSELPATPLTKGEMNAIVCTVQESGQRLDDDRQGILGGTALLTRQEAMWLLHLSDEQLQFLINTKQITVLRIAGEERFDSRDLETLIESYKTTASRRPQ